MVKRIKKLIKKLTPTQQARMAEWADRWIEIGLRTGAADREKFKQGVEGCYQAAGLKWHNHVVWVSSPLVLALAAPVAALVIQMRRRGLAHHAVDEALDDAVCDAVRRAVRDAVNGAANDPENGDMDDAVRYATLFGTVDYKIDRAGVFDLCSAVRGAVDDDAAGDVDKLVVAVVNGAVNNPVRRAMRDAVGDAVDDAVRNAVDNPVRDAVHRAVSIAVRRTVDYAVAHQAVAEVVDNQWKHAFDDVRFWGFCSSRNATYSNSFFREVCGLELAGDQWKGGLAYEAMVEAAYCWYPHRNFVMACERPTVIHRELTDRSEQNESSLLRDLLGEKPDSHRLHCADGPAIAFEDGWGVYAIHGVRIPFKQRHIVERPETITVEEIETEQNAEIRRVLIDRYGPARYVADSGAQIVCELGADDPVVGLRTARLLRKDVPRDEPIVYADLLNSTPEPDGTVKRYMLRVDPNAYGGEASRNLHAAVASTWRNADGSLHFEDWRDYAPVFES
jgi:hypothetical protein